MDDDAPSQRPRRGAAFWAVLGIALAVGLGNVGKPVHIDDNLYLSIARWIVGHPLDPYGGTITWQQVPEPAYKVSISPPLLSYVFALVIAVAGENVVLLHLAMVPWLLAAAWAVYRLGERWAGAGRGAATALLVVLGPAVAAGMNLMLDVPLLACVTAAVECLLRGLERRPARWCWYLGAGLIGAAGVGIKYPALALVPMFLAAAVQRRRIGPLAAAVGPLAALAAWQWASRSLYGAGQVQAGMAFLGQFRTTFARQVLERTLSMFAILAWTFPVWMLALDPSRLRTLRWGGRIGAALAVLLATLGAAGLLGPESWRRPGVDAALLGGVALGALAFAAAVAVPVPVSPRRSWTADDPRLLLYAWIAGVAAIVIPFGPFVAVRSFLPLQPPLAILLLRRAGRYRGPSGGLVGTTLGLTALLGGALAVADFHWAASYPAAVRQIASGREAAGRPVVFLGHWGWQYYAERAGWRPWDARWRDAPAGALVVIPRRADRQWLDPAVARRLALVGRIAVGPAPLGLSTWNRAWGWRFYGGDYGELSWGFSPEPVEEFFLSCVGPPPTLDPGMR
jgi:hypothetical protein